MTSGHDLALWQLKELSSVGGTVDIQKITQPDKDNPWLRVSVSILMGPVEKADGGLDLREREDFLLSIPPAFPFQKPEVYVGHSRFAGMPHVQWSHYLCLYRSGIEWNAADGMFGFFDRLEFWLRQGAKNQLDSDGEPLHPPAVYSDVKKGKLVVPRVDTPTIDGDFWLGFAGLANLENRIDITSWHSLEQPPEGGEVALAVLFGSQMPWEYPLKGADFFRECERHGVSLELMFRILQAATTLRPDKQPTYVVFGSAMRGIAGGPRKQHLSVWALDGETSDYLRVTLPVPGDTVEGEGMRQKLEEIMRRYLTEAPIAWCPVMEARPEVTIRRDHSAALSWFRGKTVSIWGCGALGSHIALCLSRAAVRKLILIDSGRVNPGILVRQPYEDADIGAAKALTLKKYLQRISNDIEVETHTNDLVGLFTREAFDWGRDSDVVVDTSASDVVRRCLDKAWGRTERRRVPAGSLIIDETATHLCVALAGAVYSGGTWDVLRKAKMRLLTDVGTKHLADSFFPTESKRNLFQPEPGCSEPTFIGSSADSMSLASTGLNLIATELMKNRDQEGVCWFYSQPSFAGRTRRYDFEPDMVAPLNGSGVRIARSALGEIRGWIRQNNRLRRKKVETGGLLWGEWDNATGTVWISDASGPPPDSRHSASLFTCGVTGTTEEDGARRQLSRQSMGYIGMWHTHPVSEPLPSGRDILGMHHILTVGRFPPKQNVLIIVGKYRGRDTLGIYLFRRLSVNDKGAEYEIRESLTPLADSIL